MLNRPFQREFENIHLIREKEMWGNMLCLFFRISCKIIKTNDNHSYRIRLLRARMWDNHDCSRYKKGIYHYDPFEQCYCVSYLDLISRKFESNDNFSTWGLDLPLLRIIDYLMCHIVYNRCSDNIQNSLFACNFVYSFFFVVSNLTFFHDSHLMSLRSSSACGISYQLIAIAISTH
jgi:hypothetical protein